ncbi:MFS general substrate transporter [Stereum hirsutum FP-91666 SS1]|uniref:MFS general substrate transporter n=1 Tax=Stereum hirsutum (strain FP-91666) TaxID=721885 RepID=UPI0004449A51|nr:MFS general substrate transporter [Stereum hirsutum FP-91666 SS1]EIM82916.1 MFS general substrate transporter [Stereum hirsutum FP-91666 SS1]
MVEVLPSVQDGSTLDLDSARTGPYRMYRRRWFGVFAMFILEAVASMSWPWFGPISNNVVDEFGFTLTQVNWLGNIIACMYLPVTVFTPMICSRYGIRVCCYIACGGLLVSAWVRYAGTAHSLPMNGAYALLIIGQALSAISTPVFQVLAPKYSEVWFDLKGRTTATMIISIANPIGGALGQLLSPSVGDTRQSILVLAIICTAVIPVVFMIFEAPPVPPTFAGSRPSPSILSLLNAMLGRPCPEEAYMTIRERLDFVILVTCFSVFLAAINTFSVLSAEWMAPVGYSDDITGIMGAALLIAGIVAAIATAPLFDRVLTHHLSITLRILCPLIGASWLSLIWAVRPNDTGGIFAVLIVIGAASISLLPVALELGCELTRNADGSAAILWFFGNLFCVIFVLAQDSLRAPSTANPPLNMRKAIIFNGVFALATSGLIFFINGHQARRVKDEEVHRAQAEDGAEVGIAMTSAGSEEAK